ncbi:hypothetical protein MAY82_11005 [Edwardsiella ictaluri]|nr:hypothetical protein [Edwardsiella ictaluri]WFO11804.1 hypothetical protein MAY82_11005 [Edwardsiella ictaluri]
MRESKTHELITLIYRCFIVFFCICFMANILGLLLVFFQTGYFEFNWKEITLLSLKQGGCQFISWIGNMDKGKDRRASEQ